MGEVDCGSQPCMAVVDRLAVVMTRQQEVGIASIKELMCVHYDELQGKVNEIKQTVKEQGDEIFPRLRSAEERITVIEKTKLTEEKVRDMISADETIIGWKRTRLWLTALMGTAAAGIIVEATVKFIGLFKLAK